MPLAHLRQHMERTFRQLAADKGLGFTIEVDPTLPEAIRTDEKRLQQIVLNLLSNAFKFTARGRRHARRSARQTAAGARQRRSKPPSAPGDRRDRHRHRHSRGQAEADLRGVPAGRRHHQPQIRRHRPRPVDQPRDRPPARRRAAGREHARQGHRPSPSVIPFDSARSVEPASDAPRQRRRAMPTAGADVGIALVAPLEVTDDRDAIEPGDRVVLIVEDDADLRRPPARPGARAPASRACCRPPGRGTLALARKLHARRHHARSRPVRHRRLGAVRPAAHDPKTRHIPIHVISGGDERQRTLNMGAYGFVRKPVDARRARRLFDRLQVVRANGVRRSWPSSTPMTLARKTAAN